MLPPLFLHFALMFPERPDSWARSDAGPPAAAAVVSAGAAARRARASRACSGSGAEGDVSDERARRWSSGRAAVSRRQPGRRALDHDARAARACARSRRAVSCAGSSGARRSARCRSRSATRCRSRSACRPCRARMDGGADRAGAAGLRVGDRALPPDGRRSHHQARAGLRRGAGGHCRDLRDHPLAGQRGLLRRRSDPQPDHRAARDARRRAARPAAEERDSGRPRSRLLPRSLRLPPRAGRIRARSEQRSRPLPPQRAARAPRHGDAPGRSDGAAARAGDVGRGRALHHHRPRRLRRRAADPAARRRMSPPG